MVYYTEMSWAGKSINRRMRLFRAEYMRILIKTDSGISVILKVTIRIIFENLPEVGNIPYSFCVNN